MKKHHKLTRSKKKEGYYERQFQTQAMKKINAAQKRQIKKDQIASGKNLGSANTQKRRKGFAR